MINSKLPYVYYGGDYNPDQWSEEIWKEDMRLFKLAGINIVTLPVFSWARLQPAEDEYNFEWLDKIIKLLYENNIYICLATSTAAQPAWMSKKYPQILPVDIQGRKRTHGDRVNFCPNSVDYRNFSVKLARKLAERYKDCPSLLVWHIGNEYGRYCYCEHCAKQFREWLKSHYGTLDEVNRRWNMNFWSHTIYDWSEIVPPSYLNEMWEGEIRDVTCFQSISLDYNRFMSDSTLQCYLGEYNVIKGITPNTPVTTNLMGTFKLLDYFRWAKDMDIISFDNYPSLNAPSSNIALKHDLMRGLKGGKPFMLMEQTPSQQNWQSYNSLKRPGVMKLLSYQAIAHGADTVMFFQLRRSIGACEKYHGALIAHSGHENTRVFRECSELGEELKSLGGRLIDSRLKSKVAIMFDWDNWWAIEFSSGPSIDLNYLQQIQKYYKAFYDMNISVDIVELDSDLSGYNIVVAPVLYMLKPGTAKNIEKFVQNGGAFVTTFFSGIVNENDMVTLGGYPGELRKLLGIWVEETDALPPDIKNSIVINEEIGELNGVYSCNMMFDLINMEGAKVLGVYGKDFYAGKPALTVNTFGKGRAYYVATDPEEDFVKKLFKYICNSNGIHAPIDAPKGIEITQRFKDNKSFTFILNHNDMDIEINLVNKKYVELLKNEELHGLIKICKKDVLILEGEI